MGLELSRMVSKCDLSDPMSGFFIVTREFFDEIVHRLSGVGFKILVDIVASAERRVRFAEVPYAFRNRVRGESKLDINVGLEYFQLLLDKLIGNAIPSRFVLFAGVGAIGVLIHLATLGFMYYGLGFKFALAQGAATLVAMTINFLLNNITTFRDRRLRGSHLIAGLLRYYVACWIGAIANLGFASFLLRAGLPWYIAGFIGLAVSSVWNYGVNTIFTWRADVPGVREARSRGVKRAQNAVVFLP